MPSFLDFVPKNVFCPFCKKWHQYPSTSNIKNYFSYLDLNNFSLKKRFSIAIECGNQNPDFVLVYNNNDDGYLGIVFAREKCSTRTVSHDNPLSLCIKVPYKDFYLDMKSKSVMVTIKSSKLHPYNEMEKCPTICDQSSCPLLYQREIEYLRGTYIPQQEKEIEFGFQFTEKDFSKICYLLDESFSSKNPLPTNALETSKMSPTMEGVSSKLGTPIGYWHDNNIVNTNFGIAVRCPDNLFRIYDRNQGKIKTLNGLEAIDFPILKFPVTISSLCDGDIILNGNIPCWVESIGKNHVQATDMYSFETVTIIPHSTSIGMYCYTKLFSMLSLLGITKEKLSISDVLPWIVISLLQQTKETSYGKIDSGDDKNATSLKDDTETNVSH